MAKKQNKDKKGKKCWHCKETTQNDTYIVNGKRMCHDCIFEWVDDEMRGEAIEEFIESRFLKVD